MYLNSGVCSPKTAEGQLAGHAQIIRHISDLIVDKGLGVVGVGTGSDLSRHQIAQPLIPRALRLHMYSTSPPHTPHHFCHRPPQLLPPTTGHFRVAARPHPPQSSRRCAPSPQQPHSPLSQPPPAPGACLPPSQSHFPPLPQKDAPLRGIASRTDIPAPCTHRGRRLGCALC